MVFQPIESNVSIIWDHSSDLFCKSMDCSLRKTCQNMGFVRHVKSMLPSSYGKTRVRENPNSGIVYAVGFL